MKHLHILGLALLTFVVLPMTSFAGNTAHRVVIHSPSEYYSMIENSDVTYMVKEDRGVAPTNLAEGTSLQLFPFASVEKRKGGTAQIGVQEPRGESGRFFDEAIKRMELGAYKETIELCKKAIDAKPPYAKAWTLLGLSYAVTGDNDGAEKAFKEAIKLNDIDYQAYAGLAGVYASQGKWGDALDMVTDAYVLVKNNPHVAKQLDEILRKHKLHIKSDRLTFPFAVRKTAAEKCEITYRDTNSLRWMPMANCLAAWMMEPELTKRLASGGKAETVRMYQDCIINQAIVTDAKARDGIAPSETERWLEGVVRDGDLLWLVVWDVMMGRDPAATAAYPKKDRKAMAGYIKKHVFVK